MGMNAIPKKKLCWNCEGRVAFAEENCPFCGVYLSTSSLINQQDENSTHIAPYKANTDKSIPASPYKLNEEESPSQSEDSGELEEMLTLEQKGSILPLTLLLASSVFFVFGFILLLFSHEGTLTLQWNASYWYFYLGTAAILLFGGWRSI